jgi:hypothetical protein
MLHWLDRLARLELLDLLELPALLDPLGLLALLQRLQLVLQRLALPVRLLASTILALLLLLFSISPFPVVTQVPPDLPGLLDQLGLRALLDPPGLLDPLAPLELLPQLLLEQPRLAQQVHLHL